MNEVKWNKDVTESLENARKGLFKAFSTEKNLKRESFFAVIALLLACIYKVSPIELMILVLVIGFVIALELINTALETAINMETTRYSNIAKYSKDVSAGAVIFGSVIAFIVGYIMFIDRLTLSLKNFIGIYNSNIPKTVMVNNTLMFVAIVTILLLIVSLFFKILRRQLPMILGTIIIFISTLLIDLKVLVFIIVASTIILMVKSLKFIKKEDVIFGIIIGLVFCYKISTIMLQTNAIMIFK